MTARVRNWLSVLISLPCLGQTPCAPTPAYSPCDIVFDLSGEDAAAHPDPRLTVRLEAEFRSPRHRTLLMPGFLSGGRRMVVRFAPTEAGEWDFRVTSNLPRFNGAEGKVTATASDSPGFLRVANVHHWAYTESGKAHLWMGDALRDFAAMDRAAFETLVDARAQRKFNHLRIVLPAGADLSEAERRVLHMNHKGITADLVLASGSNELRKKFPGWRDRERYLREVVARFAPLHVTWQGVEEFEGYENGRELLKEIGLLLKKLDPYQHPRSTHAATSASPLLGDGWMDHIVCGSSDEQLGAIEHQLYGAPFVSAAAAAAGDAAAARHRLWNASMNGQYPALGPLGEEAARQSAIWFEFFAGTRHWELEPYFDVDGGRALALEGIEYIVYVEKPGPVEVRVEKHGYDVAWFDPATGERRKEKKGFKGERFSAEPPDKSHDWVLHISREGHKESMLRSYKFESRPVVMQEIELNIAKTPFEIAAPSADSLSLAKPAQYAVKVTRDTRATRSMMWLWTGEVTSGGQGFRVAGTGAQGTPRLPAGLADHYPATIDLRLYGMNANGKVYTLDRIYQLIP